MNSFLCKAFAVTFLTLPVQAAQQAELAKQAPAYIQLQRAVLINADLWTDQPQILAANYGFEGIIGVPGLMGVDDLPRAVAAGAGVNLDWAALDPAPPLRNLTSAAGVLGLAIAGFGATPQLADAMPIEVSWPLLPGSVSPDNIAITLNTGEIVHPVAAALNPNYDYNERHVIVVFGEFANRLTPDTPGAIYPVSVSFVQGDSPLMAVGPDGPISIVGLSALSSHPYVAGPALVGAKLSRFSPAGDFPPPALNSAFPNDAYSLYGNAAQYRLRLFTSGGFSPDGVSGFLPTDFATFFRLHAHDAEGKLVTLDKAGHTYDLGVGKIEIIGLAEVGPPTDGTVDPAYYAEDHDNYFDIMLKGDEAAINLLQSVEIPTSAVTGYSDIYNPGGPGRTPTPTTPYTKPALPQTYPIFHSVDQPRTVSYASQSLADYDLDDDLPVVFRLQADDKADILTSNSRLANQWVDSQGYSLEHVGFANETDRPGVSAVMGYVSETGDRIYTLDPVEQARLDQAPGWRSEGRAFGAFDQPWTGLEPVYRFFELKTKRHVFTTDADAHLRLSGSENQGVAWYAALFVKPPAPQSGGSSGGSAGLIWLAGLALLWGYRRVSAA
ncbi:hypothetical protein [Pollutimonas harenae]|uniref:DUF5648 domain-containing protein n=1 Tax=Pollutimonas harenae TaxID=657015 RepID=A0A853GZ81_9BURK|nr:hypothetical protein [Pollutimonas harenae]NYT86016.1 hypothetical protein [Pollutimonas harenae]TEA71064.1 hypothetical protein ERD84_10475 [Pollutimonas harenae]